MFNRIRLWWKFEGRYYHKDFLNGVKNLIRWAPVIWKDRDWDQSYIFKVLKFKLAKQAKTIGDNGIHLNAKRDAEKMMTCVRLIDKVSEEFYQMEYSDYHTSEHSFKPTDREGYSELIITETSERFDEYFKKYPLIYKRVMNGEGIFSLDSKSTIAMSIAHINHERAKKLLFKIMEREIDHWWD